MPAHHNYHSDFADLKIAGRAADDIENNDAAAACDLKINKIKLTTATTTTKTRMMMMMMQLMIRMTMTIMIFYSD